MRIFTMDRTHNNILNTAMLSDITLANIGGIRARRCVVILRTKGCSYARNSSGGCKHCALFQNSNPNISINNLKRQLENELVKYRAEEFQQLDILTLGSFFDDKEIPEDFRRYSLKLVSQIKTIKRLLIESRPEFITSDKIKDTLNLLNGIKLEVGIGIESSNEVVRIKLLNKGYTLSDVENSIKLLSEHGISFLGYVLIKPLGMTENEAVEDAVKTIKYNFELGEKYKIPTRVALEPFYIPRNSIAEQEYFQGKYRPLKLWSVIEILRRTDHLGVKFIGLNDEGLTDGLVASNCERCNTIVLEALEKYNGDQNIDSLLNLECSCKRRRELY